MLDVCRKNLVTDVCDATPAGIERIAQVDLWEKDHFDKFSWEDEFFQLGDAGMHHVLSAYRRKLGQLGRHDHVPVVWQKARDVQEELGVSADGYWKPLTRAEDAGFVFRINQHGMPGSRKIVICKMPSESEFHAIARAKGAVERFMVKNPAVPRWLLYALRTELDNRIAAESAVLSVGRCQAGAKIDIEPLVCRDSASGKQNPSLCESEAPTYTEQESNRNFSVETSRERDALHDDSQQTSPPPPSNSQKATRPKKQQHDNASQSALSAFLNDLFSSYGLDASKTTLSLISAAYEASMGDNDVTRRELRAKVVRLAESKFSAAKIAGYLLEDCPTPRPLPVSYELAEPNKGQNGQDSAGDTNTNDTAMNVVVDEAAEFEPVRNALRERVSTHNYNSWFATMICVQLADRAVIMAPDEFAKAWLTDNYLKLISETISDTWGTKVPVEFVVKDELDLVSDGSLRAEIAG